MFFRNALIAAAVTVSTSALAADFTDASHTQWSLTVPDGWHSIDSPETLATGIAARFASCAAMDAEHPIIPPGCAVIQVQFSPMPSTGRPAVYLRDHGAPGAADAAAAVEASIRRTVPLVPATGAASASVTMAAPFDFTDATHKVWRFTPPAGWHCIDNAQSLAEGISVRWASCDAMDTDHPMPPAGCAMLVVQFLPLPANGKPVVLLLDKGQPGAQGAVEAVEASIRVVP